MAEIILKVGTVGPDPLYQDGDVIDAFNNRRIKQIHAEVVCSYANPPRNRDGNGVEASLSDFMHTKVFTHRFDPISSSQAMRTRLFDGFQDRVSLKEAHVNKHTIKFGLEPNVYWYGGQQLFTDVALDLVWDEIEAKTPLLRSNFTLAPLGTQDLKSHLALSVDDFDETKRMNLVSPRYDDDTDVNPEANMIKKRDNQVLWRVLNLGVPISDIDDKEKSVDVRKAVTFQRAIIVRRKP